MVLNRQPTVDRGQCYAANIFEDKLDKEACNSFSVFSQSAMRAIDMAVCK